MISGLQRYLWQTGVYLMDRVDITIEAMYPYRVGIFCICHWSASPRSENNSRGLSGSIDTVNDESAIERPCPWAFR